MSTSGSTHKSLLPGCTVDNLDRSITFYEAIGFSVTGSQRLQGQRHQRVAAQVAATHLGLCAVLLLGIVACRDTTVGVRTQFFGNYAFTTTERRVIARIAGDAVREVRPHLPALSRQIQLRVQSGKDHIIAELGSGGTVLPPDTVVWIVDAERPEGVTRIAESYLRQTLFRELHHLVRSATLPPRTLMDHVILEGLATAFERDVAGAGPPWGRYSDDAEKWVEELLLLPPDGSPKDEHGDRRWIRHRAGTYLVDQAMKRLNRTAAELVAVPTEEIVQAARLSP